LLPRKSAHDSGRRHGIAERLESVGEAASDLGPIPFIEEVDAEIAVVVVAA
jgi:hypothetical protein